MNDLHPYGVGGWKNKHVRGMHLGVCTAHCNMRQPDRIAVFVRLRPAHACHRNGDVGDRHLRIAPCAIASVISLLTVLGNAM